MTRKPLTLQHEAIVLRALKYGDNDIIAHLYTRESGRANVIAKGARRQKSRLGVKLDPFLAVTVQVRSSRGDLAYVQNVAIDAGHDRLRGRWSQQQAAAAALDALGRLSEEGVPNEPAYHLTRRLLEMLDTPDQPSVEQTAKLLAAYQLKLLHVAGIAPHLSTCVRCGADHRLRGFASHDGGVVCDSCFDARDERLSQHEYQLAIALLKQPMHTILDAPTGDVADPSSIEQIRSVMRKIAAPMARDHAGVTMRVR